MNKHTINISICDDESTQIQYLISLIKKWASRTDKQTNISTFESAESFLFHYEEDKSAHILLLDIQMKGLNGIELAKYIRKENDAVQIIFITGYSDFISEGYDVAALHYLLKPVKEDKFFEVLDRTLKVLSITEKSILLNTDGKTIRIRLKDILLNFRTQIISVYP